MSASEIETPEEITCRVRVRVPIPTPSKSDSGNEKVEDGEEGGEEDREVFYLVSLAEYTDTPPMELRLKWAKALADHLLGFFNQIEDEPESESQLETEAQPEPELILRPWDFVLNLDGTVDPVVDAMAPAEAQPGRAMRYPACFLIPQNTLLGLDQPEIKMRTELFAFGGLLYEVVSLQKPFDGLGDDEIQARFRQGEFPEDVWAMPFGIGILCCWSLEFMKAIQDEMAGKGFPHNILPAVGNYVKQHPVRFGFQALGGIALMASFAAVPVLGILGFSAAGPVAGSIAAGYQSSIGLVQAGGVFAWCQSAAMGGAAVGGIVAGGAAGAGVMGAATLTAIPGVKERFMRVFRTG